MKGMDQVFSFVPVVSVVDQTGLNLKCTLNILFVASRWKTQSKYTGYC